MKKILFALTLLVVTTTVFGQKMSVDSIHGNKNRTVNVYLSNGDVVVIRAIINPKGKDETGKFLNANVEGRQGILLTPPVKPTKWSQRNDGSFYVATMDDAYNPGFYTEKAMVYIVEGDWDGDKIIYRGRTQSCSCNVINKPDWLAQYEPGTYKIKDFYLTVNVQKDLINQTYRTQLQ